MRTVYKWLRRYRAEGEAGLPNCSSRPKRFPHAVSDEVREQLIEHFRQRRAYRHIAKQLGIGQSTVALLLKRKGLNRLAALEPARSDNRNEHGGKHLV